MHLLGRNLADHKPVRIALQGFFGIGTTVASRILARLQIHHHCRVDQLTEPQITALSSYLSSTTTASKAAPTPVLPPAAPPIHLDFKPERTPWWYPPNPYEDPLDALRIETDLKKAHSADIQHLKEIGTLRGKRLTAGLPVRGQRTKTNARVARQLNARRRFSTMVGQTSSSAHDSISSPSSRPFASSNVLQALRSLPSAW